VYIRTNPNINTSVSSEALEAATRKSKKKEDVSPNNHCGSFGLLSLCNYTLEM
jgi:fumarate hydratase class II